ncbi:hypothetical protein ACFQY8_01155 [Alloscardovia venturai]|uniref:Pilus assembly protein n=1 Tax=Alloscardovia venturai TaxID=1769421 RepID=A0ABW2Y283_9BIFI
MRGNMRLQSMFPDRSQTSYSAELILEMIEVSINRGSSLPLSLIAVGMVLHNDIGKDLRVVGQRLSSGEQWDSVWKEYKNKTILLSTIHDVLEPAWKRGVSASLRIENAIVQLNDNESVAISQAGHELSIRILLPLGLCFLPGFIIITVAPLLASWQGIMG